MNPILQAREERSKHIETLMKDYPNQSVVILKTNVVGTNKNPIHMRFICSFFNDLVYRTFGPKILLHGKRESVDGNYCYYVIQEVGTLVKERTISLEEYNSLGRLIDLDVYYKKPISRQDLHCDMRTCIICDNYAHICSRNKTHTDEEIHAKIKAITCDFLIDYLTNTTIKAIYSELELYPKFGLVSHRDDGCHNDMTYETFIRSTFAIKKSIEAFIKAGCEETLDVEKLIQIGKQAEQKMFTATNGINTHKGLIFALGIFLPVLTQNIIRNHNESILEEEIKAYAKQVIGSYYDELTEKTATTNGDHIYLKYRIQGIRGEALQGFHTIFTMPSIKHHNDDVIHHEYLIYLMSVIDDTTIIHKTSLETLKNIQQTMKQLIEHGGYDQNKETFYHLSEDYKKQGISPGGSADMLVIKLLYEDVKHLLRQI